MTNLLTALIRAFATSETHAAHAIALADHRAVTTDNAPSVVAGQALMEAAAAGGDLDILNYALTLEHFENALYKAILASGLLTGQALAYATTYGGHENTHVVALTDTITKLGGTPVKPLDKYNLPTVKTQAEIVGLLATVEDVGASAYLGAAPLVQDGALLTVAVQIHTVEAEHATVWRFVSGQNAVPFDFATPRTSAEVLTIVTPFLLSPRVFVPLVGANTFAISSTSHQLWGSSQS